MIDGGSNSEAMWFKFVKSLKDALEGVYGWGLGSKSADVLVEGGLYVVEGVEDSVRYCCYTPALQDVRSKDALLRIRTQPPSSGDPVWKGDNTLFRIRIWCSNERASTGFNVMNLRQSRWKNERSAATCTRQTPFRTLASKQLYVLSGSGGCTAQAHTHTSTFPHAHTHTLPFLSHTHTHYPPPPLTHNLPHSFTANAHTPRHHTHHRGLGSQP